MFATQCRVAEQSLSPLAPAIIVTIRAWAWECGGYHTGYSVEENKVHPRTGVFHGPHEDEGDCRTKTVRFRSVWDQHPCSLTSCHPGGGHESFEVNTETTDCEILLLRSALSMVLLEERLLPSACWATAPRMAWIQHLFLEQSFLSTRKVDSEMCLLIFTSKRESSTESGGMD